jgi:hypothetical protein
LIWRIIRSVSRYGSLVLIKAALFAGISAFASVNQPQSDLAPVQEGVRHDPLADRVSPASESLLKRFSRDLKVSLSAHLVTPAERKIVASALAQLAPFQREVLLTRLRAIYFIDGLPNNALTFSDGESASEPTYSIAVRSGALNETISELVTRKERTLFDTAGSDLSVTVDAGTLNAMIYVLLHEATHVVDFVDGVSPDPAHPGGDHPIASGIWREDRTLADEYRLPILMDILWRNGRPMSITHAVDLYDALRLTPFISVYASCEPNDDFAELVAWSELAGRFHQPYRIVISKGATIVRVFEPAHSHLVRMRQKSLRQLIGS